MTAAEVQTALSEVNCYSCLGLTIGQLLKLSYLRTWLLTLDSTADVSLANIMSQGDCLACYGLSLFEIMEIVLLDMIIAVTT